MSDEGSPGADGPRPVGAEPVVAAYDRLAARIREEILSGQLSLGDQLPTEPELSAHYQVSRSTAREAIRTLASQGLLTIKRGVTGGTFVAAPSPTHLSDSFQTSLAMLAESARVSVSALVEVREFLEVPAAEAAALRRTDDDLASIRAALFDAATMIPAKVYATSQEFHARLIHAAHNPLLEIVAGPVFRVLEDRFLRDRAPGEFWHGVDADHREILGYLEVRDQAGAREAARAHLRSLRGTYEQIDRERTSSPASADASKATA